MVMNDNTWYVVRNTRVLPALWDPVQTGAAYEEEVKPLMAESEQVIISYETGDLVTAISGVWEGTVGKVIAVNESKQTVTINVDMFGRETPVDISFMDIKKM